MLERAPFWTVIKIIDSFPNMLLWHCLYILVSMKGRKWQIIKRLKMCLNEEYHWPNYWTNIHHWPNYLDKSVSLLSFDCVFLSSHIRVLEWIYTLQYLKMQRDSNPRPLSGCGLEVPLQFHFLFLSNDILEQLRWSWYC